MSENQEEVVQEEVDAAEEVANPEQEAAEEAAAFEQSFHGVNNPVEDAEEPEPQPEYLTADKAQELLQQRIAEIEQGFNKVRDQAFGKIGELNRTIQSLSSRQPQEGGIKLSKAEFNKIKEYDPELAESLQEDLKNIMFEGGLTKDVPTKPEVGQYVEARINHYLGEIGKQNEVKMVRLLHPDASELVNTPEFGKWYQAQPQDVQRSLHNYDAENFIRHLTTFKQWRDGNKTKEQSKQDKLKRAAMPQRSGSGSATVEETDAFLAGFKAVRGR